MSRTSPQEHAKHPEAEVVAACRRESHEQLAQAGQLLVADARLVDDRMAISIYTDRGPDCADKDTNQDFILAWRPSRATGPRQIELIMAMADGVSSSLHAEWAAEVACWTSACVLATNQDRIAASDLAHVAFDAAGSALNSLAQEITANPAIFKPKGEFDATWAYRLRKGRLVQTTLFLAWIDCHGLHAASIGDAGAVCRILDDAGPDAACTDQVVAQCDLETNCVNAIGPHQTTIEQFDCWFETPMRTQTIFAAHTDGIARGLGTEPLALLDRIGDVSASGFDHPSRYYTRQVIDQRPKQHDDNLTLSVLRYQP